MNIHGRRIKARWRLRHRWKVLAYLRREQLVDKPNAFMGSRSPADKNNLTMSFFWGDSPEGVVFWSWLSINNSSKRRDNVPLLCRVKACYSIVRMKNRYSGSISQIPKYIKQGCITSNRSK